MADGAGSGRIAKDPRAYCRYALMLWLVLAVAVAVKTFVSPDEHSVYPKTAARSWAWWAGEDLYVQYEDHGRFPYSPTFAIALTPFTVLGNRIGGTLWVWTGIAVCVLGLRRLIREVLPGSWPPAREAALLALAMIGAIRGVWNAQSNALIIGLIMLGASAMRRGKWWQAAVLLGGPVFIKLWAVAMILLLVSLQPRQLAVRLMAVLTAAALLPFLTQSPDFVVDQYKAWLDLLSRIAGSVTGSYRDLWTIFQHTGVPVSEAVYRVVQVLAGGVVLVWCLWLRFRGMHETRLMTTTLAAGAAWAMLLGPAVEYNTYVVLAPFVSWALLESLDRRSGLILASAAFGATMILGAGVFERMLVPLSNAALFTLPAGTLLFVVWLLVYTAPTSGQSTS